MREAINNSFLTMFILVFIILMMLLVAGSLSYTKAFKVKNRILNIIETRQTYNNSVAEEIDNALLEMGYRVNIRNSQNCPTRRGALNNGSALNAYGSNYRYCVYQYDSFKGPYFEVIAYMYFDIPIISSLLEIPVHGQTKVIYII